MKPAPLATFLLAACGSTVPAELELVDGHHIEIATAGTGTAPTVVFEAGLGDDWTPWDDVAAEVAQVAPIFAYSRPGYGASDPPWTPRNPAQIVGELHGLLAHQGYAPPYVLVGHSMGGTYMELFAKAYPAEVAGVVLVDPRPRNFLATCEAAELDWCGLPDPLLATQAPAAIAEYRAFAVSATAEIEAAGTFGAYPVRVLTATVHPVSPAREALWESELAALAAEAPDGAQILVEGTGHYIQVERPDLVTRTILDVLGKE